MLMRIRISRRLRSIISSLYRYSLRDPVMYRNREDSARTTCWSVLAHGLAWPYVLSCLFFSFSFSFSFYFFFFFLVHRFPFRWIWMGQVPLSPSPGDSDAMAAGSCFPCAVRGYYRPHLPLSNAMCCVADAHSTCPRLCVYYSVSCVMFRAVALMLFSVCSLVLSGKLP